MRPDVIYSTGQYLFVEFKTDDYANYRGFKLTFSVVQQEEASGICQTSSEKVLQLSGSTGTFFTPFYPVNYPKYWTCIWQISVPAGKRVKLIFEEFEVTSDEVQIRDGKLPLSRQLPHHGGREVVYSTGSYMRVKFYSRYRYYRQKGFKARFEALDPPGNPNETCFPGNRYNNNLKLTGSSGRLQNPEERYFAHLSCTWLITVPAGKIVQLSFERFNLPGRKSSKCTPDYVEILDGKYSSSESRGRFCGNNKPEDSLSSGQYMTVRFRSGGDEFFYQGFEATFTAENPPVEPAAAASSNEQCHPGNVNNRNLKLTGTEGTLQTPLEFYPPNLACVWVITVPEGNIVQLTFERFDLNPKECFDYVSISDGRDSGGRSLGIYCGNSIPEETIKSSDRYMWIRFNSAHFEADKPRSGFKASFKAIPKSKTLLIVVAVTVSLVVFLALLCCVASVIRRRKKRGETGGERIPMTTTTASRPTQSEAIDTPPSVGYAPVPTNPEATTDLLSNQVELPPPYPGHEQVS